MPIEVIASINEPIEAIISSDVQFPGEGFVEAGQVDVSLGATSVVITLKVSQPDADYTVGRTWFNNTDLNPQFQSLTVIAKTLINVTLGWNAPTDTANYKIDYSINVHNP